MVNRTCVIVAFVLTLGSCKKDYTCISNYGKEKSEKRQVNYYNKVVIEEGSLETLLLNGKPNEVLVEGGSNLIDKIETEVIDSTLYIRQKLACHWLRNYSKKNSVTFYADTHSIHIIHRGSMDILSSQPIHTSHIKLECYSGGGWNSKNISSQTLYVLGDTYSTFTIGGYSVHSYINLSKMCVAKASELNSQSLEFVHYGELPCTMGKVDYAKCYLYGVGDLEFAYSPSQLEKVETSSGRVLVK